MLNFLVETFLLGLKNLRLHKLRSLLTALGIIFGVAAVIIMVAIGEGAKQAALRADHSSSGRRTSSSARSARRRAPRPAGESQRMLDYGLHARRSGTAARRFRTSKSIVPLRDTEQNVVARRRCAPAANAIGTTPDIFDVINLRLAEGRFFTTIQYDRAEAVCVIGYQVARQLFPFEDPIGKTIRVGTTGMGTVVLTVIGVLEPTGLRRPEGAAMMERDLDLDVYFPLTLAAGRVRRHHRQAPGRRDGAQADRADRNLAARPRTSSDVEPLAGWRRTSSSIGNPRGRGPRAGCRR